MPASELTHGSLFAGIGGFDLGLEQAGIETLWQVEIDAKCNEVLSHHWPDVQRYGDIKNVGKHNLEPVGIISGGFPCVGLSVAGRRAGLADARSGLWWEMLRVIEELRPTWVVVENVPGLRSSWSSMEPPPCETQVRDFAKRSDAERWAESMACDWEVEETSDLETILASLGQLGYWWAFRSLDAQYHNLAQRRERVFIVGRSGDLGRLGITQPKQDVSRLAGLPAKVLFESESLSWDSAPLRGKGEDVTAPLKASSPSRRAGGSWPIAEEFVVTDDIVKHALSGHNQRNDPDGEHFVVAFDWQSGGDVRLNISSEHTSALQASQVPAVAISENQRGEVRLTEYSSQLSTGGGKPGQGYPAVLIQSGIRRLTVTECERLQGFPPGFTDVNGMSNTARYRMLGNAVAVPKARWLGGRIMLAHIT